MKIVVTKNNIREGLQLAERFTGKNLTLPILGNILFEAGDNQARLAATNLEMGVEISIPCKVIKDGAVTIPGKIINTLIQTLDEETVTIEEKDSILLVKTDSSYFSIQGLPPKDFPILPKIKKEHEFTISSQEFRKGLTQVVPSAAVSDFKPELASIFIKKDAKALVMAATDSFRLAEKSIPSSSASDTCSFILPVRTAQELIRILQDEGELTIREGENQALFVSGNIRVVSRLVDGVYPDYQTIIPRDFGNHIVALREDLVRKIRAASIMSSKLNDIVVNFGQDEFSFETFNTELGKSKIQFSAKTKGKSGKVSFNFRYLLDGVEAVLGEEAILSLNGDSAPALIQDPADSSFRYVVMPIRNV